jgi:membrane-associated protein
MEFFSFNLVDFIKTIGAIGIAFIIFAECGLFIGLIFPGDSLLFTAGFLASQGYFDIATLTTVIFFSAIAGNMTGYATGKSFGPKIFSRKHSRFFKPEYLERTTHFFEKYGAKAIFFSRFFPIIRTITPLFAGAGIMRYKGFILYTILGALAWGVALPLLGFTLGKTIPDVDKYLVPMILGIVFLSLLPALFHAMTQKKKT